MRRLSSSFAVDMIKTSASILPYPSAVGEWHSACPGRAHGPDQAAGDVDRGSHRAHVTHIAAERLLRPFAQRGRIEETALGKQLDVLPILIGKTKELCYR